MPVRIESFGEKSDLSESEIYVVMIANFQTVTDSGNGTSEALKFKLHLNSRIYKSIFNRVSHKNGLIPS